MQNEVREQKTRKRERRKEREKEKIVDQKIWRMETGGIDRGQTRKKKEKCYEGQKLEIGIVSEEKREGDLMCGLKEMREWE